MSEDRQPLSFTRSGQAPAADEEVPRFTRTRRPTVPQDVVPADQPRGPHGEPRFTVGQSLRQIGRDLTDPAQWRESLRVPGEIARDTGSFVGDFFRWMTTTDPQERTATAGRMLGKVGDVGAFLTGGFAGPEAPAPFAAGERVAAPPTTAPRQLVPGARAFPTAPTAATERFGQLESAGITPRAGVMGGPVMQAGGRVMRRVPMAAGPVERGIQENQEQAFNRTQELASRIGNATTSEEAGAVAQNAMKRFAADRTQAATDYNRFYALMHGAPAATMPRTLRTLEQLHGRFPNAPELEGLFTNPKFGQLRRALEPRTETIPGTPAQTSRILDPSGRPATVIPGTPARTVTRPGALTMPEIKELQSQIGYLIEDSSFGPENIPKAQLRSLYSSLSADLRDAARARGPAALQALTRAQTNYAIRMNVMERLEPILRGDRQVDAYKRLNAAAQSNTADSQLLRTAKNIMKPQEWSDIGAAMVRKLAYPQGVEAADTLGPDFSLARFHTNWSKMTDKAKDLVFGPNTPGSVRSGLETLSDLGQTKLLDPSSRREGTRAAIGAGALVEEVMRHVTQMRLPTAGELGAYTGVVGGAYSLSKLLMSPRFSRWLYQVREQGDRIADPVGTAQKGLQEAMAAAEADRRRADESNDLRRQAYDANRRGNIAAVQRFDRQRSQLPP